MGGTRNHEMPEVIAEQEDRLELRSGRSLGYALYGARHGPAVFVLDGPGSRGLARSAAKTAGELGLRLIAPDRPGFGASTADPGRSFLSWSSDFVALADALDLDRVGVLAQSGGCPYALACAYRVPGRVARVAVIGGVAPLASRAVSAGMSRQMRTTLMLARRAPWLLRRALRAMARQARRSPERVARRIVERAPPADRRVLADDELWQIHVRTTAEALASPASIELELRLLTRPWGFELGDLRVPVVIWEGERDTTHPPAMAHYLAERIPGSELQLVPDVGTFGMIDRYDEILRGVASRR
jgi:pimeloyl-ACP methyl ester carboxylesterase